MMNQPWQGVRAANDSRHAMIVNKKCLVEEIGQDLRHTCISTRNNQLYMMMKLNHKEAGHFRDAVGISKTAAGYVEP